MRNPFKRPANPGQRAPWKYWLERQPAWLALLLFFPTFAWGFLEMVMSGVGFLAVSLGLPDTHGGNPLAPAGPEGPIISLIAQAFIALIGVLTIVLVSNIEHNRRLRIALYAINVPTLGMAVMFPVIVLPARPPSGLYLLPWIFHKHEPQRREFEVDPKIYDSRSRSWLCLIHKQNCEFRTFGVKPAGGPDSDIWLVERTKATFTEYSPDSPFTANVFEGPLGLRTMDLRSIKVDETIYPFEVDAATRIAPPASDHFEWRIKTISTAKVFAGKYILIVRFPYSSPHDLGPTIDWLKSLEQTGEIVVASSTTGYEDFDSANPIDKSRWEPVFRKYKAFPFPLLDTGDYLTGKARHPNNRQVVAVKPFPGQLYTENSIFLLRERDLMNYEAGPGLRGCLVGRDGYPVLCVRNIIDENGRLFLLRTIADLESERRSKSGVP